MLMIKVVNAIRDCDGANAYSGEFDRHKEIREKCQSFGFR